MVDISFDNLIACNVLTLFPRRRSAFVSMLVVRGTEHDGDMKRLLIRRLEYKLPTVIICVGDGIGC